jgi:hypothetical protein
MAGVEDYMVSHPSNCRLHIYSGAGSSTDSFDRAQRRGYERCRKTGHGNLHDLDRQTARGHGLGNHL